MLVLLPPSETKRDGGDGAPLELSELAFPELAMRRRTVISAVTRLARSAEDMMTALKLGPRQAGEVERNRSLTRSATMPALDRYTGVLYDALDAATLSPAARERARGTVLIQSALLGPVDALDLIPAYRLSSDSRLPGLPLKAHWASAVSAAFAARDDLILDLRSEAYAALGPAPSRDGSFFVRVVTRGSDGGTRALNHFNKKAKGEFVRALLTSEQTPADEGELFDWAGRHGMSVNRATAGILELTV